MKNLTKLALGSVLVLGLVINGCSGEKERLVRKVMTQADSIGALQRDLLWKSDSLVTASVKLSVIGAALDSQMQAHTNTALELRQISSRLAKAKHDYERLVASTEIAFVQRDSSQTALKSVLSGTIKTLLIARGECEELAEQLNQKTDLILKVRSWYYKWRHDATERSFLEVLFASDKAKSPDYPEPEADFRISESVQDTNSGRAISDKSSSKR